MLGRGGQTRYWLPANSGEHACANALRKKGLLGGSAVSASDRFYLTDRGLAVARALRASHSETS